MARPTDRLSVMASIPFFAVHLACFAAFFVTFHWYYPLISIALYYMGMFFVTAGYHRYFSHRAFKTSRAFQFFLAFMAMTSSQKGVLWWAAHHRNHHRFSDTEEDIHSPTLRGFLWSHVGWILCATYNDTEVDMIRDFHKFPELRTMGEGWHNNHHHYMASVRQGFFWWEVDATYYTLKVLSWFHIVWDLRMPPVEVLRATEASS
ncbi:MAG: acyl-CoA desaturase [Acidobacteria bacterium]|nr:acyl-CoA desaturase [Acidobacteriota bacterium]